MAASDILVLPHIPRGSKFKGAPRQLSISSSEVAERTPDSGRVTNVYKKGVARCFLLFLSSWEVFLACSTAVTSFSTDAVVSGAPFLFFELMDD